ncbi:MAG TPA: c-type cytochrome [Kofleriaceae bacterium]|nr:c-type cytochrome [Kofleriaceae bacterium]
MRRCAPAGSSLGVSLAVSFTVSLAVSLTFAACGKSGDTAGPRSGSGSATATGAASGTAATAEDPGPVASVELGRELYEKKGCAACHSIDGSPRIGPSLLGAASRATASTRFTDGTLAKDLIGDGKKFPTVRAYLIASFLQPSEYINEGYPPTSPSFEGVLKPHESESLALFVESLGQP